LSCSLPLICLRDNLTLSVALDESVSDTSDEMSVKSYIIPGTTTINNYDLESYAISNIDVKYVDINHRGALDADLYSFNLVATSASNTSFYIVVASSMLDDNNTHNITISGSSTSVDNTTQSFICAEGSACTNTTTSFDYAISVKRRSNALVWTKEYDNLANGEHWFHVRRRMLRATGAILSISK